MLQKKDRWLTVQAWLLVLIILLLLSMIAIWYWYDRQLEQLETKTTNPSPVSWMKKHQPPYVNQNAFV